MEADKRTSNAYQRTGHIASCPADDPSRYPGLAHAPVSNHSSDDADQQDEDKGDERI
jgi:hypothetical protein